VRRFQGTLLAPRLSRELDLLRKLEHVIAFRLSSDLAVMADDGTHGEAVLRHFRVPAKTVYVRKNGVALPSDDTVLAARECSPFPPGQTSLLTVSRLAGWKRVDRAIRAISVARETALCSTAILNIVGDGDQRASLESLTNQLGLRDHVVFHGAIPRDRLPCFYANCDVFLSLYDLSNVGNPLLEALAYGRAVVTFDVGDTRSVVDGHNGVLLTDASPERVAGAIVDLVASPERRLALGAAARQYACSALVTWSKRMTEETAIVRGLLDG
jgi:glycosyltransferase involved in cell wall biosynthesis